MFPVQRRPEITFERYTPPPPEPGNADEDNLCPICYDPENTSPLIGHRVPRGGDVDNRAREVWHRFHSRCLLRYFAVRRANDNSLNLHCPLCGNSSLITRIELNNLDFAEVDSTNAIRDAWLFLKRCAPDNSFAWSMSAVAFMPFILQSHTLFNFYSSNLSNNVILNALSSIGIIPAYTSGPLNIIQWNYNFLLSDSPFRSIQLIWLDLTLAPLAINTIYNATTAIGELRENRGIPEDENENAEDQRIRQITQAEQVLEDWARAVRWSVDGMEDVDPERINQMPRRRRPN